MLTSHTSGAAGPSGVKAQHWSKLICQHNRPSKKKNLCRAIAKLTERLAREVVPPVQTHALFASRLIAFDKQPGIRPIGIGAQVAPFCNIAS
jgi:hypothetical protein